jgi:hypothetical protein
MFLNLDNVCLVDQITDLSARLVFSPNFTLTIHGKSEVEQLLAQLRGDSLLGPNNATDAGGTVVQ